MSRSEQKVVQYLNEAYASETALIRVLQSQIAMTPDGRFRQGLEKHLEETRGHASRLQDRIHELKEGHNPLLAVVGLAETIVGQAMALAKTPADLVRGTGGEEKILKNAKDAAATEALEIATYAALEELAAVTKDRTTAKLAASIRKDEERMLEWLLDEIPSLTRAVVQADVDGDPPFDPAETGAAQAVKTAVGRVRGEVDEARDGVRRAVKDVRAEVRGTVEDAKDEVEGTVKSARRRAKRRVDDVKDDVQETIDDARSAARRRVDDVKDDVQETIDDARSTARRRVDDARDDVREKVDAQVDRAASAARKVPGAAQVEGGVKGATATEEDLPIARYDSLNADDVVARLPKLSQVDLVKVSTYERLHADRKTVIERAEALVGAEPWPGYDEQTAAEIQKALGTADGPVLDAVAEYERRHKARAGVLKKVDAARTAA